jgi:hypothetical protein
MSSGPSSPQIGVYGPCATQGRTEEKASEPMDGNMAKKKRERNVFLIGIDLLSIQR